MVYHMHKKLISEAQIKQSYSHKNKWGNEIQIGLRD